MSTTLITATGFAAALLTTIAFLPQAVKIWRSRSSRDVSLGMAVTLLVGVVLWLAYGLLRRSADHRRQYRNAVPGGQHFGWQIAIWVRERRRGGASSALRTPTQPSPIKREGF